MRVPVPVMPALQKARAKAQGIQCKANLRMCHVALMAYAADHRNFPPNRIHAGAQFWHGINPAGINNPDEGAAILLVRALRDTGVLEGFSA